MPATYDESGQPISDAPGWEDVREGTYTADTGQMDVDESGNPAVTVTVTNKGSNLLGLAFLAAALYFLMSGSDK